MGRTNRNTGYYLLSVFLLAALADGKEIVLFDETGKPAADYAARVAGIQAGDELKFSGGKKIQVGPRGVLGKGNTTLVIDGGEVAIRIPLHVGFHPSGIPMRTYLGLYLEGAKGLEGVSRVAIKDIHPPTGTPQFIAVEKLPAQGFTLQDFLLEHQVHKLPLPKGTDLIGYRERVIDKLLAFAAETSALARIGDFNPSQLFFDTKAEKWILFDWTTGHVKRSEVTRSGVEPHAFEESFAESSLWGLSWNRNLKEKITAAILKRRGVSTSNPASLAAASSGLAARASVASSDFVPPTAPPVSSGLLSSAIPPTDPGCSAVLGPLSSR